MTNERDALEAVVNLLYLIENHAHDPAKVVCFVNQAAGPIQVLTDSLSAEVEQLEDAA